MLPRALGQTESPNRQERPRPRGPGGGQRRGARDDTLPPDLAPFAWLSLVLGRVSDRSVTVSAVTQETLDGYFEFGTATGRYDRKTDTVQLKKGTPVEWSLVSLDPDTLYYYRFVSRTTNTGDFVASPEYRFHTARAPGSTFTFTMTADAHLDSHTSTDVFRQTLANIRADHPDFHLNLGNLFMTDKHSTRLHP